MRRTDIEAWLDSQGALRISAREWEERFDALVERRKRIAEERGYEAEEVEQDAVDAVAEVRSGEVHRR